MANISVKSVFAGLLATLFAAAMLVSLPAPSYAQENIDKYFEAGTDTYDADTFQQDTGLGGGELNVVIADIINVALGFLGVVAVIIIMVGGFKWMVAGGADDKIKSARKLLFSGIIGLVIVLAAYAIAKFVIELISKSVAGPT